MSKSNFYQKLKTSINNEGRFFKVSLFCLSLLLFVFLFRWVLGENYWVSVILLYMPQKYFIYPFVFLLIISLLFRKWISSFVNLVSILIVVFLFMQYNPGLFRGHSSKVKQGQEIKVLTYNIRAGTYGRQGLTRFLSKADADIIFLQEARQTTKKDYPDPIPLIVESFEGWNYIRGGNGNELMILSRFPFLNYQESRLGDFRKCLMGEVIINGRKVLLINVHFSTAKKGRSLFRSGPYIPEYLQHTADVRKEQVDGLVKLIPKDKPVIMAGDFNSPPNSQVHRKITKVLKDSFDNGGKGMGLTFSSRKALWRIDYIYASKDFIIKKCKVLKAKTSDHLPVWSRLVLTGEKNK